MQSSRPRKKRGEFFVNSETHTGTACIACSIFKMELENLKTQGRFDLPVYYLDSLLHMYPDKLEISLAGSIEKNLGEYRQVILLFGDCHARMVDQAKARGVERVAGINCMEILLGKEVYRKLRREGAFLLLPEWAYRWDEIFFESTGLQGEEMKSFMREMNTKLVYLDSGLHPVREEKLQDISKKTGLPYEVRRISLDHMAGCLREVLEKTDSL